jgi:hypothetical protein
LYTAASVPVVRPWTHILDPYRAAAYRPEQQENVTPNRDPAQGIF